MSKVTIELDLEELNALVEAVAIARELLIRATKLNPDAAASAELTEDAESRLRETWKYRFDWDGMLEDIKAVYNKVFACAHSAGSPGVNRSDELPDDELTRLIFRAEESEFYLAWFCNSTTSHRAWCALEMALAANFWERLVGRISNHELNREQGPFPVADNPSELSARLKASEERRELLRQHFAKFGLKRIFRVQAGAAG